MVVFLAGGARRCSGDVDESRLHTQFDVVPTQQIEPNLAAARHERHASQPDDERNVGQAQYFVLQHHGFDRQARMHPVAANASITAIATIAAAAARLLTQPAQAPIALHGRLKIGIGGISRIELRDDREQVGVARLEMRHQRRRHAVFDAGQNLPLVDQVGIAAQRRSTPGVLIYTQALVRRCMSDHAYLHLGCPTAATASLAAVNARHATVVHQLAPTAVGKDHQLGHDLVERRTTAATGDGDHIVVDIKIKIDPVVLFRLQAKTFALDHPALLQHLRPLPQHGDVGLVRIVAGILRQIIFRDQVIEVVVTQVAGDRYGFGAGFGRQHRPVSRIERGI